MLSVKRIDHVAITVADIDRTCAFYQRLFGCTMVADYAPKGVSLVRQITLGAAMFSVHRLGNGVRPVARQPTMGSADICLFIDSDADAIRSLLEREAIAVVEGPVPRRSANGTAATSLYVSDPDGNLIELMYRKPKSDALP